MSSDRHFDSWVGGVTKILYHSVRNVTLWYIMRVGNRELLLILIV